MEQEQELKLYIIRNRRFVIYDELTAMYPSMLVGVRNKEEFIEKHQLIGRYTYARLDKNTDKWNVSIGNSCRVDKFFIRLRYVELRMTRNAKELQAPARPALITLSDREAFFDNDGNRLEVEVAGERDANACYFKLVDIARVFGMTNLVNTVTHVAHDGYQEGEHYCKFRYIVISDVVPKKRTRIAIYLTYLGVLRAVITTKSKVAESFVSWVTKTLFTAQMGTTEQRRELGGKLIGLDASEIKRLGKATSGRISCVYLYALNTVGKLRDSMEIPDKYSDDNAIVYKFGKSIDLEQRTRDHVKNYGTIDGVKIELAYYSYIDPEYISKAEASIAHMTRGMGLAFDYSNSKELIIASSSELKLVKEHYDTMTTMYRGSLKQIVDKLEKAEYRITIADQRTEIVQAQLESSQKDTEILRLKLQIAESRNQ